MWTEIFLFFFLLFLYWVFQRNKANSPRGPIGFPFLGHLPLLGRRPYETIAKWSKTYGPIMKLQFGEFDMIALHGHDVIKEAYEKMEFSGRPLLGPILLIADGKKRGFVASEGDHWSQMRRFALRQLRDFGFGKKTMEGVILEDAAALIKTLEASEGTPINTSRMLSLVVVSALWEIVSGVKIAHDHPSMKGMLDKLAAIIGTTPISGPIFFFPSLAKLAPNLTSLNKFREAVQDVKDFMRQEISDHRKNFDENNLRDFIDVFMNEVKKETDTESPFYGEIGEENMLLSVLNLFGAGAEPTSNTINWAFYLLAKNKNAQKKMQAEIDNVIGKSSRPSLEDKSRMPYVDAVMNEVFRYSSITPFGIFHSAMETVENWKGYTIPKNTVFIANLYDVHHNPEVWGDPDNFRPDRFLEGDRKSKPVIPFLVGKRSCLGETLARAEFFLILTAVVQHFNIDLVEKPSEDVPSFIRFPPKHELIFKTRS